MHLAITLIEMCTVDQICSHLHLFHRSLAILVGRHLCFVFVCSVFRLCAFVFCNGAASTRVILAGCQFCSVVNAGALVPCQPDKNWHPPKNISTHVCHKTHLSPQIISGNLSCSNTLPRGGMYWQIRPLRQFQLFLKISIKK